MLLPNSIYSLNGKAGRGFVGTACHVNKAAVQAIPVTTPTTLVLDTELYDPHGMHTGSNGYITLPSGQESYGMWIVGASVWWADTGLGGNCELRALPSLGGANVTMIAAHNVLQAGGTEQNASGLALLGATSRITFSVYYDVGPAPTLNVTIRSCYAVKVG